MFDLRWSWLCVPYAVCAAALAAVGVVAAVVRGDRVMRLGVIGAATTALPWAISFCLVSCTDDAEVADRLFRLGTGPVALIGPNLLLVLLGVSGQLERHRWAVGLSGAMGTALLGLCWGTSWTVPGVHRLTSGMFYVTAGPLTDVHIGQLAMWIAVGVVIARRSMMRGEREQNAAGAGGGARAGGDRRHRHAARPRHRRRVSDRVAAGDDRVLHDRCTSSCARICCGRAASIARRCSSSAGWCRRPRWSARSRV